MKSIIFKNKINGDKVICENPKTVEVIEGVEYITVRREGSSRTFKMRKDVLEKISSAHK